MKLGQSASLSIHDHLKPPLIKAGDTVVLVSHATHLAVLDQELCVCASDWIAWRDAVERGFRCFHIEAALVQSASVDAKRTDFFEQADSWMFDDVDDMTLFHGVSLGKMLTREASLLLLSVHQIATALDWICAQLKGGKVVLKDVRTEFGLLDAPTKRDLVRHATDRHGCSFVDDLCEPPGDKLVFPFVGDYTVRPAHPSERYPARQLARQSYSWAVDLISRLRSCLRARSGRVLLVPTGLMLRNILRAWSPECQATPMIIAEREPKNPRFVLSALRRGVIFVHLPARRLMSKDRKCIEEIAGRIDAKLGTLDGSPIGALHHYVRRIVCGTDVLLLLATEVLRREALLRRCRPARIVVTDVMNPGTREFIELGSTIGIPVDFLPHGMRISRQYHDALTGSGNRPPLLARLLSWGRQAEDYLTDTQSAVPAARVGYPALDHLRKEFLPPAPGTGNALVLPYSVDTEGFVNMSGFVYSSLVSIVRNLRQAGYPNVRVKVHPGSRFNADYYRKVLAGPFPDVPVIHDDTHLPHYLAWADIVVGPVVSSTVVETIALGRPYVPLMFEPTVNERAYLGTLDIVTDESSLARAVRHGPQHDPEEVLEYFCSRTSIASSSLAFWKAMVAPEKASGQKGIVPTYEGARRTATE